MVRFGYYREGTLAESLRGKKFVRIKSLTFSSKKKAENYERARRNEFMKIFPHQPEKFGIVHIRKLRK